MQQDVISVSQLTTFCHCRYSWYLHYISYGGIRLKDEHLPLPIRLGSIWDEFQNHWYTGKSFKAKFDPLIDKYDIPDDVRAKLHALISAWYKMSWDIPQTGQSQVKFTTGPLRGVLDILYADDNYFLENKLTGRPEQYKSKFTIHNQASSYFLSDPSLKYVIVRPTRTPLLKLGKKETLETFQARVKSDILSRPSHYFLGFDRTKNTFGIKFHRGEFDLEGFKQDVKHVLLDINNCRDDHNKCYQDKLSCFVPAQCEYLSICETGGVNWHMFDAPEKPKPITKEEADEPNDN